jgi:hypothetical protein
VQGAASRAGLATVPPPPPSNGLVEAKRRPPALWTASRDRPAPARAPAVEKREENIVSEETVFRAEPCVPARREVVAGRRRGPRAGAAARLAVALACVAALAGCTSETLFQSNFESTPQNQPPAAAQAVGTARVQGPPGSVLVVAPPVTPSDNWVQVSRPEGTEFVAGLQGVFPEQRGDGKYTFTATLFMPSSFKGIGTLQFEPFTQPVDVPEGFLHIDLTQDNTLRINHDDSTAFGRFPRDKPFIVEVTLNIGPTSTAHVALAGADTDLASADFEIPPPLRNAARQFGAIRVWMGFPWTGFFDATNIVVRKSS